MLGSTRWNGSLYVALDPAVDRPRVEIMDRTGNDGSDGAARPELEYSRWPVERLVVAGRAWTCTARGFGDGEMIWRVPDDEPLRVVVRKNGIEIADSVLRPTGKRLRIPLSGTDAKPVSLAVTPSRVAP